MKISLLDCGKWAITENGAILGGGGLLFDTYEEAEQFFFVYNTLPK